MRHRVLAVGLALLLWVGWSAPLFAAPTLVVTPSTVQPGQTIQIVASGVTLPDARSGTLCVGVLGPGQNVALGRSPAFRPKIGQIVIGPTGSGQTSAALPAALVAGEYQVVIGGCAPQPDLAPLAALASASLAVVAPGGAVAQQPASARFPQALPHTGAGGAAAAPGWIALIVGGVATAAAALRRRARR